MTLMTEAARTEGRTGLVMPPEEWERLVLSHLDNPDITAFSKEVSFVTLRTGLYRSRMTQMSNPGVLHGPMTQPKLIACFG